MRKLKLNDYCEFPLVLDMEPYTKEGLERKEAQERQQAEEAATTEQQSRSSSPAQPGDNSSDASSSSSSSSPPPSTSSSSSCGKEKESAEEAKKKSDAHAQTQPQGQSPYLYRLAGVLVHSGKPPLFGTNVMFLISNVVGRFDSVWRCASLTNWLVTCDM